MAKKDQSGHKEVKLKSFFSEFFEKHFFRSFKLEKPVKHIDYN